MPESIRQIMDGLPQPPPGTPLALARLYGRHAHEVATATQDRLAITVANLAATLAAFIEDQETTNDLLAQHGPNAELALRLDGLERRLDMNDESPTFADVVSKTLDLEERLGDLESSQPEPLADPAVAKMLAEVETPSTDPNPYPLHSPQWHAFEVGWAAALDARDAEDAHEDHDSYYAGCPACDAERAENARSVEEARIRVAEASPIGHRIHRLMDGIEWSAATLDAIAGVLTDAGYVIAPPAHERDDEED